MRANKTTILLVSLPGMLQEVLSDELRTDKRIEIIGLATGGLSAFEMLKGRQPDVLLVNTNIPLTEAIILIEMTQEKYPETRCVALAETSQDQDLLRDAGAEQVIAMYTTSNRLIDAILDGKHKTEVPR